MDSSLSQPLKRKQKKHKIGCCKKLFSCICCCFIKKGVKDYIGKSSMGDW